MNSIKILTSHHALPNIQSVNTLFFDNLLPVLQKRIKVQMNWLVYQPEKLSLSQQKDNDNIILDIHDYNNAVELMRKEKPDIVFAYADAGIMDYALSLAAKFLKIPVVSGFHTYPDVKLRSRTTLMKSIISRSLENTVPTDTTVEKKQFMRRGRFFVYKYLFLLKTQLVVKMNILKIVKEFLLLVREYTDQTKIVYDARFANTLHWLEGESLIETLVKAGFQRSSLVLTGSPMYDKAFQQLTNYKQSIHQDGKIRVLLVTTSMYEHGFWTKTQRDDLLRDVVKKISQHKDKISLKIKIHPSSEILLDYSSIVDAIDPEIPIYQKGDIIEYIKDSDVVISYATSSALVYALIAKKPIIICDFYDLKKDVFLEKALAIDCKTPDDLISSIQKIHTSNPVTDKKIDDFVREFFYKSDGRAAERLCDAIMGLINKK